MSGLGKAIGLFGLVLGGAMLASSPQPVAVKPAPLPPPPAPLPKPRPKNPPPLTLTPKGRHLTDYERWVLSPFFSLDVLTSAPLWFSRPPSSFTGETDKEEGMQTEAVTTRNGIYFRFDNHEIDSPYEFALLAHELKHWEQWLRNQAFHGDTDEVPAYQMQIAVKASLDNVLEGRRAQWTGERYA